mmetsp:Transcript_49642/g.153282  ORF Transcript_49642/g.153282 Transcript_49642/m.153282 type:complete len:238 (+) Transcript_49642:323-1036(+)
MVLHARDAFGRQVDHGILGVGQEERRDLAAKAGRKRAREGVVTDPRRLEDEGLVHVEAQGLEVEHRDESGGRTQGVAGDQHPPEPALRRAAGLLQRAERVLLHVRPRAEEAAVHPAARAIVAVEAVQVLLPKLEVGEDVGGVVCSADGHDAAVVRGPLRQARAPSCADALQARDVGERGVVREDLLVGDELHGAGGDVEADLPAGRAAERPELLERVAARPLRQRRDRPRLAGVVGP